MALEIVYVCTGGCGGQVSQAEYEAGKTICGTTDCPHYQKPFEKRLRCTECEAFVEEGHTH